MGYARKDVAIEPRESVSLCSGSGAGRRAFAVLVDLATGRREQHTGSWGGSNMFNPRNAVDNDTTEYPLPVGGAVLLGSQGNTVYCSIVLHPANVAKLLPAASTDVTDRDRSILAVFGSLKSCARKEYLDRMNATGAEVDSLVSRGYLSRNRAGATQITTAGKNARGDARYY